ncbi:unnamed protein product, partial [Closterium sp. NIES-54]
ERVSRCGGEGAEGAGSGRRKRSRRVCLGCTTGTARSTIFQPTNALSPSRPCPPFPYPVPSRSRSHPRPAPPHVRQLSKLPLRRHQSPHLVWCALCGQQCSLGRSGHAGESDVCCASWVRAGRRPAGGLHAPWGRRRRLEAAR